YTRKSTDERLDMEFNSLDAQREACLSYIASQKSEGWVPVLEEYDDGGFSGGNMDRPALTRLMEDIKAGKIQTVVVYKIDRLTRSLMDFAKLVEVFDAHGVTFVSITQSFNTTTSMGRLTLNVLLSFAQFEREVAGERIRDKIAASKRKGMWMGGTIPLGYDVKERQLIVNEGEAERVRHIFMRYLEIGNLNDLYQDLNRRGVKGKPRQLKNGTQAPAPFCSSTAQYLISNPTYIGKVRHKGQIYEGQHEPIVPPDLWQAVQDRLTSQSMTTRNHRKHKQKNLLRGLLFDQADRPYVPTYTNKPGRQYRYYKLHEKTVAEDALDRIPAHEIESRVAESIRQELAGFERAAAFLGIDPRINPDLIQMVNQKQACLSGHDLVLAAVQKVIVDHESITLQIKVPALSAFLVEQLRIGMPQVTTDETRDIKIPYITRRAHKGSIMIEADKSGADRDPLDLPSGELRNLVRGLIWRDEHFSDMTLRDIGNREGFSEGYIGKCIFKTFADSHSKCNGF
ncbi:MAG TPA: recombinase family protein, partial [Alphaproteobacteria bacterium]|nr:recombinase family protein [Alphaproteobacteria bacterium]